MSKYQNHIAGLQVLQNMGIVHRNISTANIVLHEGEGKLIDLECSIEYQTNPVLCVDLTVITFQFLTERQSSSFHLPRERHFSCQQRSRIGITYGTQKRKQKHLANLR